MHKMIALSQSTLPLSLHINKKPFLIRNQFLHTEYELSLLLAPPCNRQPLQNSQCKCPPAGASGKATGGPAGSATATAGSTGSDREDFHRAIAAGGSSPPGVAWLFFCWQFCLSLWSFFLVVGALVMSWL